MATCFYQHLSPSTRSSSHTFLSRPLIIVSSPRRRLGFFPYSIPKERSSIHRITGVLTPDLSLRPHRIVVTFWPRHPAFSLWMFLATAHGFSIGFQHPLKRQAFKRVIGTHAGECK
ncbi:hypothetical protein NPIL_160541 [Nephila pilipes]|uniref:Uncharacterized protein n=1 Tax=Nephila pilipes TaxID=299642 RepID=A0A8X6MVF3_NEPPI|nr:hypothetical protein NPIL_160541 [Nephila pilipes]